VPVQCAGPSKKSPFGVQPILPLTERVDRSPHESFARAINSKTPPVRLLCRARNAYSTDEQMPDLGVGFTRVLKK